MGTCHKRQSGWMRAPPAGVSVGTHITKVPLAPALSKPSRPFIHPTVHLTIRLSVHPSFCLLHDLSLRPSFLLFLYVSSRRDDLAAGRLRPLAALRYHQGQDFAPPKSWRRLCKRKEKKKKTTQTVSSFVIFFSSAPSESAFLTYRNFSVIVVAKAALICLPERDGHQHSSSLVSYFLRPPLSHRITCSSRAFNPTRE